MDIVPFGGWDRCARIVNGAVEMIVTLEVGPRILFFGFTGGPNELVVNPKTAGLKGDDTYHTYGGHRLWIAPETHPKTFTIDNSEVDYIVDGDEHVFTANVDTFHIQKQIRIRPNQATGGFEIEHRVYNRGGYAVEFAPWAPTQCAPGGVGMFPQAPFESHSERLLPTRPLVMWSYTKLSDPRWTWGDRVVRLEWRDMGPTKIGTAVEQGYCGYANHGNLFLKRFAFEAGEVYPDMGCNYEMFSRQDMLEIESLGPLEVVEPQAYADLRETWYLVAAGAPPENDEACANWLEEIVSTRPL